VRIETVPLILGILIALLGLGIIFDAWTPDAMVVAQERRRRARIERHRNGEALIGFGVLALAGAFIGRDNWRYSVLVVIIGAGFLIVGAFLNGAYLRELFVNRGPLRRREATSPDEDGITTHASDGQPTVPVSTESPRASVAAPPADDVWDGAERRKTPRTGEKRGARGTRPDAADHG
jgi:hypothetical protein